MVYNSRVRNIRVSGIFMSIENMQIDMVVLYKLLNIIYEKPGISLTELFKIYREKEGVKVNYNKVKKHIQYAEIKGLVEIDRGKPAKIKLTKKGIDYLFLMSRVLQVLGESI